MTSHPGRHYSKQLRAARLPVERLEMSSWFDRFYRGNFWRDAVYTMVTYACNSQLYDTNLGSITLSSPAHWGVSRS
jgi:hypothetical protein